MQAQTTRAIGVAIFGLMDGAGTTTMGETHTAPSSPTASILVATENRSAMKRRAEDGEDTGAVKRQKLNDGSNKRPGTDLEDGLKNGNAESVRKSAIGFLELPREIRDIIYEHACITREPKEERGKNFKLAVGLIGASKQIRSEALPVMFKRLELRLHLHPTSRHPPPDEQVLPYCTTLGLDDEDFALHCHPCFAADLTMLSHLRKVQVQAWMWSEFSDPTMDSWPEYAFNIAFPHDSPSLPSIDVEPLGMSEPEEKYRGPLKALLGSEIQAWAEAGQPLRYSKGLVECLLRQVKHIQSTAWREREPRVAND